MTVCCSSPERFLSCGRGGMLEAKPIKGTARRHPSDAAADWASAAALLGSEKERAENLMIVDLLRNDLGRCATYLQWTVVLEGVGCVCECCMLHDGMSSAPPLTVAPCLQHWRGFEAFLVLMQRLLLALLFCLQGV